jgi:hypothetical protein
MLLQTNGGPSVNAPLDLVELVTAALQQRRLALEASGTVQTADAIVIELHVNLVMKRVDVKVRAPSESLETDAA